MHTKKILIVVAAAALVLITLGCGSSDSDDSGDPNDSGAGTTASGGDESVVDSGSATLPEGWPDELALPDDTTLVAATDLGNGAYSVIADIDGDTQAVFDTLEGQLEDAGYEIVNSTFTPSEEGGFGSISARGDVSTVAIAFGPDATGDVSQVTISVAETP